MSASQRDLLRAQVELRLAEIELDGVQAEARASRAKLNGMLARDADAPLALGRSLPEPRTLPVDDAALIAAGVENNPELRALAFAVTARQDALDLARLQYLPDFNPFAGFTGSIQQTLGVGVSLPTRLPQIRAGIEEARAMLREAGAELRQAQLDRRTSFRGATLCRERQAEFFARGSSPWQSAGCSLTGLLTERASRADARVLLDVRLCRRSAHRALARR